MAEPKKIEGATARQRLRPLLLGRKVFEAFRLNPGARIDLAIFSGKRNLEASLWKAVHGCAKHILGFKPERYAARLKCCGPSLATVGRRRDRPRETIVAQEIPAEAGRRIRQESPFPEFGRGSG